MFILNSKQIDRGLSSQISCSSRRTPLCNSARRRRSILIYIEGGVIGSSPLYSTQAVMLGALLIEWSFSPAICLPVVALRGRDIADQLLHANLFKCPLNDAPRSFALLGRITLPPGTWSWLLVFAFIIFSILPYSLSMRCKSGIFYEYS